MKTLWKRFKSEVPKFWKKVQILAGSIGSIATAIWIANSTMGLELDAILITICKYTLVVCSAITLQAQFTIKDNTSV